MATVAHSTDTEPAAIPPSSDEIDSGFGKAIILGAVVGIPVFMAIMAAIVKAQWDLDWPSTAAIAAWTGIWAGLFMGGTIVVGRWSAKNMH